MKSSEPTTYSKIPPFRFFFLIYKRKFINHLTYDNKTTMHEVTKQNMFVLSNLNYMPGLLITIINSIFAFTSVAIVIIIFIIFPYYM